MTTPAPAVRTLFLNLPVADVERSTAFFVSLGFDFNPTFTDETAAMLRLIDRQRTLAHAGADIQIACFDATPAGQPFSDPTRSNAIDHSPPGSWPSGNDARAWPSRATSTGGIPDVNATAVWLAVPRRVLGIALAILRAKH